MLMSPTLGDCVLELQNQIGQPASFHMIDIYAHHAFELDKRKGARPTAKVVLLLPDGKVVLVSRNKKNEGKRFCFPGGGIEYNVPGENLLPALMREVEEEARIVKGGIDWDGAKFLGPHLVQTKRDGWKQKLLLPVVCRCTSDFEVIPNLGGDGPPDQIYTATAYEIFELLKKYPQRSDRKSYIENTVRTALRIHDMHVREVA